MAQLSLLEFQFVKYVLNFSTTEQKTLTAKRESVEQV